MGLNKSTLACNLYSGNCRIMLHGVVKFDGWGDKKKSPQFIVLPGEQIDRLYTYFHEFNVLIFELTNKSPYKFPSLLIYYFVYLIRPSKFDFRDSVICLKPKCGMRVF